MAAEQGEGTPGRLAEAPRVEPLSRPWVEQPRRVEEAAGASQGQQYGAVPLDQY